MLISLVKKYGIVSLLFINLSQAAVEPQEECLVEKTTSKQEVQTSSTKPWYKSGMFWFGLLNGLELPLPYAVAIGFNLVDISHPAVQEKLKPFAQGACAGIGLWLIHKILTLSVFSAIAATEVRTHSQTIVSAQAQS